MSRQTTSSKRRCHNSDRVGGRGLRPGTLPHHRTCGFPHTAIGALGILPSQARGLDNPGHSDGLGAFGVGPIVSQSRVVTVVVSHPAVSSVLAFSRPVSGLVPFVPSALRSKRLFVRAFLERYYGLC